MLENLEPILAPFHSLLNVLSAGDSTVKGFMTLGIAALIGWLNRNVPARIMAWFHRNFMVTISVIREDDGDDVFKLINDFVTTYSATRKLQLSSTQIGRSSKLIKSPGSGVFVFFHGFRPYIYNRREKTGDKGSGTPEKLTLTTIGRDVEKLIGRIEGLESLNRGAEAVRSFYISSPDQYGPFPLRKVREIGSSFNPVLDPAVKKQLDDAIDHFSNKQWYRDRHLTRKLVILLYGPPGSGKTHITRYVADRLNMGITKFMGANLPAYFDRLMNECAKRRCIFSYQDIDDNLNLWKREFAIKHLQSEAGQDSSSSKTVHDVSLKTFLNSLDGEIPLEDAVVVMSTNHFEVIDEAVYRPGRVTLKLFIGALKPEQVVEFIKSYYLEDVELPIAIRDKEFLVSVLMSAFEKNPNSVEDFLDTLVSLSLKQVEETEAV